MRHLAVRRAADAQPPGSRSKPRAAAHETRDRPRWCGPRLLGLARGWALSLQRHGAAAAAAVAAAAQPVRPGASSVAAAAAAAAAAARLRARRARPELYAAAERRQVGARRRLPAAARGCASAGAARDRCGCLRRARGLHLRGTLCCT